MFIRKKKLLNEIDVMFKDNLYWIEFFNQKGDSSKEIARSIECTNESLADLSYFIKCGKRYRPLQNREKVEEVKIYD